MNSHIGCRSAAFRRQQKQSQTAQLSILGTKRATYSSFSAGVQRAQPITSPCNIRSSK